MLPRLTCSLVATECVIREERPADHEAIADVTRLAFSGRQFEVDMVAAIRASDEYVPNLSLVADLNGQVIGHCILARTVMGGPAALPALQLGPVSVHPAWQRRGVNW